MYSVRSFKHSASCDWGCLQHKGVIQIPFFLLFCYVWAIMTLECLSIFQHIFWGKNWSRLHSCPRFHNLSFPTCIKGITDKRFIRSTGSVIIVWLSMAKTLVIFKFFNCFVLFRVQVGSVSDPITIGAFECTPNWMQVHEEQWCQCLRLRNFLA